MFALLTSLIISTIIPQLGNCRDAQECHIYCEVAANKPACWAYAQSRVLGDSTPSATPVFPIVELGNCANKDACKAYCEISEHHDACADYARTHHLGKLPAAVELIEKAKAALGCDSLVSCKAICENAVNKDKCKAFTLKFAPPAIKDRVAAAEIVLQMCHDPASRSTCVAALRPASGSGEMQERQRLGADCKTADECRTWCQGHPLLCPPITTEIHATISGIKRLPITVNPPHEFASDSGFKHTPPTTNSGPN